MAWFPIFVDLEGKPVLLVGGGRVAQGKLEKLLGFHPAATVVAPEIREEIQALPGVRLRRRKFRLWDLWPRPALVICATGDREADLRVSRACRRLHIPVNVADDAPLCTFFFPALAQKGRFCAGFSTGGASPTAAAYYKSLLQAMLPDDLEEILSFLERERGALKKSLPDQSRRGEALQAMLEECLARGRGLTPAEAEALLRERKGTVGSVTLVGAGCGRADLITLRGLAALARCQAVVYDDLIDPALLALAPASAQRLNMGKRGDGRGPKQEDIHRTLIRLAGEGLRVVRLKGGDPYLFGRGGEEMLALKAAGIPCREVPGIPSAIGIPAEAGIPVTHRGLSRGVYIVTGRTWDTPDGLPEDLDTLARLEGTLVLLMGLGQLPQIAARLIARGKSPDTPAAVLSGGNSTHPAQVRAPLSQLPQAARDAGVVSPAVIVVGKVAGMELFGHPPEDKV